MAAGGAALKAGGPSNFAARMSALARALLFVSPHQNRFLRRRLRGASASLQRP